MYPYETLLQKINEIRTTLFIFLFSTYKTTLHLHLIELVFHLTSFHLQMLNNMKTKQCL